MRPSREVIVALRLAGTPLPGERARRVLRAPQGLEFEQIAQRCGISLRLAHRVVLEDAPHLIRNRDTSVLPDAKTPGERLRLDRIAAGLSLRHMSVLTRFHRVALGRVENGVDRPRAKTIAVLALVLAREPGYYGFARPAPAEPSGAW